MTRISVGEARKDMAATLNRVAFGGTRIVLHRRGKNVAALVPIEDLELLERIEDHLDVKAALEAAAEAARKGEEPVSWEKVKAALGR